jgi:hypothetical protein
VLQLRVTANVAGSLILSNMMMAAIRFCETSEPHGVTSQKTAFFIE